MIPFLPIAISQRSDYEAALRAGRERGCEYSFANLYLWGRQKWAKVDGWYVFFSQFNRRSVYPFPVGSGDLKPALDAIIHDAQTRGIPCRITGMSREEADTLQQLYPGMWHVHPDRDSYDYVYDIHDLADLKGRKYQKKRNHLNKFRAAHPDCTPVAITRENMDAVQEMLGLWYTEKQAREPQMDFLMERRALEKALKHMDALRLEAMALQEQGKIIAITLASRLSESTFDVHFEKAFGDIDGAYTAINQAFSSYLREKYPQVQYLNREDDLGLEGLRKAKLSYLPHHMTEKCWACLLEDGYDY